MNAQHLSTDELADAAEGLLDPDRATAAESHIAHCLKWRAQSDALGEGGDGLRCGHAANRSVSGAASLRN